MLFQLGVTLVAIIPRLPTDRPFPYSIGGDLSYKFRRVVLLFLCSNTLRKFFETDSRFSDGTVTTDQSLLIRLNMLVIFRSFESFLLAFLCLLTPYLMQCQLQHRINISQPGRDLMMWIYLVTAFGCTGCILVECTNNISYWSIKKLGDALSFPPIYKTLKLYSSIISPGGKYPGRGDVTVQTLLTIEYLNLTAALLSAVGYFMIKDMDNDVFNAFRNAGAYSQLTRLLCHAMLMNARDEADYFSKFATTTEGSNDNDNRNHGEQHYDTVSTIALVHEA